MSRAAKIIVGASVSLSAFALTATAKADAVYFIPPNDTAGHVFSTNSNDGYSAGRGDVFNVLGDTTIDSVSLYQNLTNVALSYQVSEVIGALPSQTVLRSGTRTVSTSGLEFIDFSFASLNLLSGHTYQIAFSFGANSNANFFYDNQNVPFNNGHFRFIDGTQGSSAGNSVMPAIRLNEVGASGAVAPLPAAVWGGLALMGGLGLHRVRRRCSDATSGNR